MADGILGNLEAMLMNPLTLGGIGLLSGGGVDAMQQGMKSGVAYRKERRSAEEIEARRKAIQDALQGGKFAGMSDGERAMLAADPEMAKSVFQTVYAHQLDPMTPYKIQQLQAQTQLARDHGRYYRDLVGVRAANAENTAESMRLREAELARKQQWLDRFTRDRDGNLMLKNNGPVSADEPEPRGHANPSGSGLLQFRQDRDVRGSQQEAPDERIVGRHVETQGGSVDERGRMDNKHSLPNRPMHASDPGLTDETIQAYYTEKYGSLPKGSIYRRDGTVQNLMQTASERMSNYIANDALEAVRRAREVYNRTSGLSQAAGHGVTLPYFGTRNPGALVSKNAEDVAIARKEMQSAVHDILRVMSGATVSDRERDTYTEMYLPRATDTLREQNWKMDRIERFFLRSQMARKNGATDEDIAKMIRAEIGAQNSETSPRRSAPRAPASQPDSGWSIKRLN
jgi:hypothetical protein